MPFGEQKGSYFTVPGINTTHSTVTGDTADSSLLYHICITAHWIGQFKQCRLHGVFRARLIHAVTGDINFIQLEPGRDRSGSIHG